LSVTVDRSRALRRAVSEPPPPQAVSSRPARRETVFFTGLSSLLSLQVFDAEQFRIVAVGGG
jgi:hypothetical protein